MIGISTKYKFPLVRNQKENSVCDQIILKLKGITNPFLRVQVFDMNSTPFLTNEKVSIYTDGDSSIDSTPFLTNEKVSIYRDGDSSIDSTPFLTKHQRKSVNLHRWR